jgi:uncharacterized protein YbjT (DUF2867 family)
VRVLVTGATGFVGHHVVSTLIASGHEVVAVSRTAAPLPSAASWRTADVTNPSSLEAAARGCDACVHLVAIIVERGRRTFDAINAEGTRNVVRAAEAAGVRRLVHLSALGASPDDRFPYLASKWRGEEIVRASGVEWTVLRPSVLYGEGAGFFRPIVWTMRWAPVYPLPAGGRTRFSPLAIEDLASCVVRALEGTGAGETVDLGGPDVMTFDEIVRTCMRALGKRRRIVSVPLWAARPFAAVQGLRADPLVTNGQLDMVVLDNVAPADSVWRAFGFAPRRFVDADLRWLAKL